jgi:hypothetical protein
MPHEPATQNAPPPSTPSRVKARRSSLVVVQAHTANIGRARARTPNEVLSPPAVPLCQCHGIPRQRDSAVRGSAGKVSCVPRRRARCCLPFLWLPSPSPSSVHAGLALRVPPGVARALGRRRRGRAGGQCNFAGLTQEKGRPSSRFYSPFRRSPTRATRPVIRGVFLTTYTTTTTTPGRPAASKACQALPPTPIRPCRLQLLLFLLYLCHHYGHHEKQMISSS